MTERKRGRFPAWVERERAGDLAWIGENLHVFWPVAQRGYEGLGRGAIVVDTTSRPTGEGHPFGYFPQEKVEETGDEDARRLVREYDATWEMVTVLLKTHDRVSVYRVGVIRGEANALATDSTMRAERSSQARGKDLSSPDFFERGKY